MSDDDKPNAVLNQEASVAKSLFLGNIIEENLFPYPFIEGEQSETLKMVIESIDRFMESRGEDFRKFDEANEQPQEYLESLKEIGLFGLIIPEEHGGLGFCSKSYSRVAQQTSRYDGSTSITIGAHSSIGMRGVLLFGNDEQKKRYLPKLATGEMIAAFCLTESGSGSDAASIKSHATKNEDGTWTLNGEKIWITNGPFADFFTVFARTESEKGKLSAFLVERSWEGVSTGPKEDKMGLRSSGTSTVSFNNVKIPAENLLGEEGKGFKIAVSILNSGRTGLGGGCVGAMKASIERAAKYAKERKQFGKSISEFGLIKEKIARMTMRCFAAESVVNMVAALIDSGVKDYSVEAAISKIYATEALWEVSNEALQIAGGNGYMKEYPYERTVRDARINMIFEGTNEILRLFVALSGFKDAGEYLKEIGKSANNIFNDPIKGFGLLSGYANKRFSQLTSLGRDKIEAVDPSLREQAEVFEIYTLRLGKACDEILRRLGKDIIGHQFTSKRIADTVIDIFVGLCVISRASALIGQLPKEEAEHVKEIVVMYTQDTKRRMNQNLRRLYKNEDNEAKSLADFIVDNGGTPWDVLK